MTEIEHLTLETATELQYIKQKLEDFEKAKSQAITIDKIIDILHSEEQYLKSLKNTLKSSSTSAPELLKLIEAAVENDREHIIMELEKRVRYGLGASIFNKSELIQELRAATHSDFKRVIAELDYNIKKFHSEDILS